MKKIKLSKKDTALANEFRKKYRKEPTPNELKQFKEYKEGNDIDLVILKLSKELK